MRVLAINRTFNWTTKKPPQWRFFDWPRHVNPRAGSPVKRKAILILRATGHVKTLVCEGFYVVGVPGVEPGTFTLSV